jgi:multidrug efflux pump subunit AcrA (membrane-fusion protein)
MVDVGQVVSPGQRIARVFSTDAAEVRVPLSDADLALLGLPIAFNHTDETPGPQVRLSAQVAGAPRTWTGRLARTDSAIDPRTRTLTGIVEVIDPYGAAAEASGMPLAIGLFVDAEVDGALFTDIIELPREALRGADEVFVAQRDGTLSIRTATVVYSGRDRAIVSSGVEPGDMIVTSPVLSPRDGMKIEAYDQAGTLLFPPRPATDPKPAEGAKS